MRVLFVTLHFEKLGGLEFYTIETVRALRDAGAEVTVISVWAAPTEIIAGVPVISLLPRHRLLRRFYHRLWPLFLWFALRRLQINYDLGIAGHLHVLPHLQAFTRRHNLPSWAIVYGIEVWRVWSKKTHQALVETQHTIAISQFTADIVKKRLPKNRFLLSHVWLT